MGIRGSFVGIRDPLVGIRGRFVGIQPVGGNSWSLRRNSDPFGRNSRRLRRNSARWWEFAAASSEFTTRWWEFAAASSEFSTPASSEFSPLVGIRGGFVGIQPVGGNRGRFVGIRGRYKSFNQKSFPPPIKIRGRKAFLPFKALVAKWIPCLGLSEILLARRVHYSGCPSLHSQAIISVYFLSSRHSTVLTEVCQICHILFTTSVILFQDRYAIPVCFDPIILYYGPLKIRQEHALICHPFRQP